MGGWRWLALGVLLAPAGPAFAEVDRSYERAVTLIERMYLYPEELDSAALLRAAAHEAADEVDWLLVEPDGDVVHLAHGDGTPIGAVSVQGLETLPTALERVEELITEYPGATTDVDVRLALLSGMTDALDRYSRVLAGESLDRFDVRLKGTLVGIGATIGYRDDAMTVVELSPAAPAERGGVQVGDEVLRIDGVSTVNMPVKEAVRRIRGDVDTVVTLGIRRADGAGRRDFDVTLKRAEVVVPNVVAKALPGGVGYVAIDHFSQRTVQNLEQALIQLDGEGSGGNGLVIDLRQNTGGSMREAARSADLFLESGLLLTTEGRNGERVQNLQGRMDAVDEGDERDVGVVVLMDSATASGAEILAGALLQHGRAVLLGTRSFGKGTVQKIYNLDDAARLKLTVAQYILEGRLKIADGGLIPDIALGTVKLDRNGMRLADFDEARVGVPFSDIVPVVDEYAGWRGTRVDPGDVPVEVARRALIDAGTADRDAVLGAARVVAAEVRAEQERRLVDALAAKGVDWSAGAAPRAVRASVDVWSEQAADDPDTVVVHVRARNTGSEPLPRALVELGCASFSPWDDVRVPLGRVLPGKTAEGVARVALRPGLEPREDEVDVRLRVGAQAPVDVGAAVLVAQSGPAPKVLVHARLGGAPTAPVASIEVVNRSAYALDDLDVYFEAPGDLDVELLDRASRIPHLGPGDKATITLRVEVGADAPAVLPLRLIVENEDHGSLAQWVAELPRSGARVALEPPRIESNIAMPLSAAPGRWHLPLAVEDDARIDHAVLYVNGDKVAWAGGGLSAIDLGVDVDLAPGSNRIVAVAVDDQHLVARQQWTIRGEATAAVDADVGRR